MPRLLRVRIFRLLRDQLTRQTACVLNDRYFDAVVLDAIKEC